VSHASIALALLIVLAACTAPSGPRATGPHGDRRDWLDEPLVTWNAPDAAVPGPPQVLADPPDTARCARLVRSPSSAEERSVAERGWSLIREPETRERITIVIGSTAVDGMCRPLGYQGFVFVEGRFAGTLSPVPMDARSEGAQTQVSIEGPGEVRATYARYRQSDPLCCPSRTSVVTFGLEQEPRGPVLVPREVVTTPRPP